METTNSIGDRGRRLLREYCAGMGYRLHWVDEDIEFQLHCGDCIVTSRDGIRLNAEVKAEVRFTGNLFIETWSNRSIGRKGWLYRLNKCDVLYYCFLDREVIYTTDFQKLRACDLSSYQEVPQWRHEQDNDTYGLLVPIRDLRKKKIILAARDMPELRGQDDQSKG